MNKGKIKCGVVTFHHSHNYGSVLQAYSMLSTLSKLGLDVEIINFRHPCTTNMYEWHGWLSERGIRRNVKDCILRGLLGVGKKHEKVFNEFIEDVLVKNSEKIYDRKDIQDKYDILVCGSDQIWNPFASGRNDPAYFLDFSPGRYKFSYAVSSYGVNFAEGCHSVMYSYLKDLKYIGVRDMSLKRYIKSEFNIDSVVNPDPTLLLSSADWSKIEEEYKGLPEKYLLIYTISNKWDTVEFASKVAKILNLKVVYIETLVDRGIKSYIKFKYKFNVDYRLMDVSPMQFIWLFHHAQYIVTNTFHGNVFSIIFRKNFVTFKPSKRDARITTLHGVLGFGESRMCEDIEDFKNITRNVDYNSSTEKSLSDFLQSGLDFMRQNIDNYKSSIGNVDC